MGILDGKRAIVTGSSRGLGRAYARALAAAGASVVVNGTTPDAVAETVQLIGDAGGKAVPCLESVSTFEGAERLVGAAVEAFGGVDILVNNAGVIAERMMFNMTDDEFRGPMNVDYYGTFAVSRHAARDMRTRRWGRIINTGDTSPMVGLLGGTNVGAAKGGIHAMTLIWAVELQRYGITANCIIPNAYTRMHDPLIRAEMVAARERGEDVPPFEEYVASRAQPEQITPFLVYLASDDADWVTGQIFGMHRDELILWTHPTEKVRLVKPDGFTLENVGHLARETFATQLEPIGRDMPWMKKEGH